jgi:hypothetical protein
VVVAHHAIVIGIDGYLRDEWKLDGAVRDALLFSRWLVTRGGVAPENLRLLLSPRGALELPPELAGCPEPQPADSSTLLKVVSSVANNPPGGMERLFVYFSGHGCSAPVEHFNDQGPVLIPVDYQERYQFNQLLPISVILSMLAPLDQTEQFFFLDACRDFVPEGMMPALLAGATQAAALAEKQNQFSLYATSLGQRAEERGRGVWTRHLLASLQGAHGALTPSPDGGRDDGPCYKVQFQPLARFVQEQIQEDFQRLYPHDWQQRVQVPQYKTAARPYDPVLATFAPEEVAPLKVSVLVDPRSVLPTCRLRVLEFRPGGLQFAPLHDFAPLAERPKVLELPINHYRFEGEAGGYERSAKLVKLTRSQTVALELKEIVRAAAPSWAPPRVRPETERTEEGLLEILVKLELMRDNEGGEPTETAGTTPTSFSVPIEPPDRQRGPRPKKTSLKVLTADPAARVVLLDATQQPLERSSGRETAGGRETIFSDLTPGLYQVELHLPEGKGGEEMVLLEQGESGKLALAADPVAWPPHLEALAERLGLDHSGYLHPAKALGAIARPPLTSLLSFAAFAAHRPTAASPWKRLREALPVTPFAQRSTAGLVILVGSAVAEPALGLTAERLIRHGRCTVWRREEGAAVVVNQGTLRPVGDAEILGAAAEWQLPLDRTGSLEVELGLPHFAAVRYAAAALPGRLTVLALSVEEGGAVHVQQHIQPLFAAGPSAAERLRLLDLAERLASRGDFLSVLDALDAPDLRNGEWLDPVAGTLLGYALVRAGEAEALAGTALLPVLLERFPELPDVHVLAGLCAVEEREAGHFERAVHIGLPIFAEGARALMAWARGQNKVLPPEHARSLARLLPGSLWTAWNPGGPSDLETEKNE